MKKLCIYHANCADGFGAAWAVRHALKDDVEFQPGDYAKAPPDVTGRDVIMVDFSYKREPLLQMAEQAKHILILDHHTSAEAELTNLPSNVTAIFDMARSGAMLAWQHFHPEQEPPELINHIEDRDLWKFKLPQTKEVMAAVFSYPYEFPVWDQLMAIPPFILANVGNAILRAHHQNLTALISAAAHRAVIAGHDVPALNAPHFFASDAGNVLSKNEPFAACYYDTGKQRKYSLRSSEQGLDVSKIAELFGGGGHRNAAGFSIDLDRLHLVALPQSKTLQ